jgi:hypothetical protein
MRMALGLEKTEDARRFLDKVVLAVSSSPQDTLAQYIYQGRAALDFGVPPQPWLRVHRYVHLTALKLTHYLQYGTPMPEHLMKLFDLDDPQSFQEMSNLFAATDHNLAGRLSLAQGWEVVLRKAAARKLLAEQSEAIDRSWRQARQQAAARRKSARIPVSPAFLRAPRGENQTARVINMEPSLEVPLVTAAVV